MILCSSAARLSGATRFLQNAASSRAGCFSTLRRVRPLPCSTHLKQAFAEAVYKAPDRGGLEQAMELGAGETYEDYLKKASLSPWVPTPDPVARRIFELAKAGPDDVHLEFGSGDGRMNFHALDAPFYVQKSIGVDVDEKLIGVAQERLDRRHPKPDLTFLKQDLLDTNVSTWKDEVPNATIITMYFVQEALLKIRPLLEASLRDNQECRIICCGYSMPGWEARWSEIVLDLPIYVYHYGDTEEQMLPFLSPQERAAMQQAEAEARKSEAEMTDFEEEVFPTQESKYDDVEEIEVPFLGDPTEQIDNHWDDFDDDEEETDLDGNPAISQWRKPE